MHTPPYKPTPLAVCLVSTLLRVPNLPLNIMAFDTPPPPHVSLRISNNFPGVGTAIFCSCNNVLFITKHLYYNVALTPSPCKPPVRTVTCNRHTTNRVSNIEPKPTGKFSPKEGSGTFTVKLLISL